MGNGTARREKKKVAEDLRASELYQGRPAKF